MANSGGGAFKWNRRARTQFALTQSSNQSVIRSYKLQLILLELNDMLGCSGNEERSTPSASNVERADNNRRPNPADSYCHRSPVPMQAAANLEEKSTELPEIDNNEQQQQQQQQKRRRLT